MRDWNHVEQVKICLAVRQHINSSNLLLANKVDSKLTTLKIHITDL